MGMRAQLGADSGLMDLTSSVTIPSLSVNPGLLALGVGLLAAALLASGGQKRYRATSQRRTEKKRRVSMARMQVKAAQGKLRAARRSPGFFG